MRLIDADELLRVIEGRRGYGSTKWEDGFISGKTMTLREIKYAPTVEVPQPLTRDGVLAAAKAIEDAGGKAVVEVMHTLSAGWMECWPAKDWSNPDVPRWNVRVRAVEVETEDVPLTQLVGRTIAGEDDVVTYEPTHHTGRWWWQGAGGSWRVFPDGTLDLATAMVTVLKGEA